MASHKKAKRIMAKTEIKPQAPDAASPKRPTDPSSRIYFSQFVSGLENLAHGHYSKTRRKEIAKAVCTVIDTAKRVLPDIIGEDDPTPYAESAEAMDMECRYYNLAGLSIKILFEGCCEGNPVSVVRLRQAADFLMNLAASPEPESATKSFEEIPSAAFSQRIPF